MILFTQMLLISLNIINFLGHSEKKTFKNSFRANIPNFLEGEMIFKKRGGCFVKQIYSVYTPKKWLRDLKNIIVGRNRS